MALFLVQIFLLLLLFVCAAAQPEELLLEESAHAISMSAPVGGKAYLECDANPSIDPEVPDDKLTLAIWYKQGHVNPVYSYDTRSGVPKHWTDQGTLGDRAKFRLDLNPAALVIERLRAEDSGQYRCRVDFSKSPTVNARHNLTILLPPKKLLVLNDSGSELANWTLGPYGEGTTHNVTCIAIGGEPAPRVSWWKSHALLSSGISRTTVQISAERHDHGTELTCQAVTDQSMPPMSVSYKIAVKLTPLWVKIQGHARPLVAGQLTEMICQVVGATPRPSISWWKSGTRMRSTRESLSEDGNVTTSILNYTPMVEDAGKVISCRSVQASLPDSTKEDGWKLTIHHTPVPTIKLGSSLNGSNIVEGSDVYMDCEVKSNPAHNLVYFTHNGEVVKTSNGVMMINQTLVLQHVSRNMAGMFVCKAKNQLGEESSNKFLLDVKYAPRCQSRDTQVFRAARGEVINITCNVEANPTDSMTFKWWLNETSHIRRELTTSPSGSSFHQHGDQETPGILQYRVETSSDYGWIMCSAKNTVGEQSNPCSHRIVPANKPSILNNCTVLNITYSSLAISCEPGDNGGIEQHFLFKVYDISSNTLLTNISSDTTKLTIPGLPPGTKLLIHALAYNRKGYSDVQPIQVSTQKLPEKRTGFTPVVVQLTPLLACVIGATVVIIVLATVTVVLVRCRSKKASTRNSRGNASDSKKCTPDDASNSPLTANKDSDSIDSLDKNPDIIPLDCKQSYDVRTATSDYGSLKPLLVTNPEKYEDGSLKRLQADSASQFSQYSEADFTQGQYIQIRPIDYRLRPPQVMNPNIYGQQMGGRHVYDTVYEDMLKFRNSPCGLITSDMVSHHPELYISPHGPLHAVYTKSERGGTITPTMSGEPSRFDSPINGNEVAQNGNFATMTPYTLPLCNSQRQLGMASSPYVISSTLPQVAAVPRDRRHLNQPVVQTQTSPPLDNVSSNQ